MNLKEPLLTRDRFSYIDYMFLGVDWDQKATGKMPLHRSYLSLSLLPQCVSFFSLSSLSFPATAADQTSNTGPNLINWTAGKFPSNLYGQSFSVCYTRL